MFELKHTVIDAFVQYLHETLTQRYPGCGADLEITLERAARSALETIKATDCQYHDLEHTILVTDAGVAILDGYRLAGNDLPATDWLHAIIAMLFHDIGYRRGILADDGDGRYVGHGNGHFVETSQNATDAALTPWHVDRGRLYVDSIFSSEPLVDSKWVASLIEMTRFPVPQQDDYRVTDTLAALVRAADLIGQMGDPDYHVKQARLFAEFKETGETDRLGVANAHELRERFHDFFYSQVFPYVSYALGVIDLTPDGETWHSNLSRQVHGHPDTLRERVRAA